MENDEKPISAFAPLSMAAAPLLVYWGIRAGRILFLESYKVERMMQNQTREEYDALKKVYEAAGVIGE